MKIKIYAPVDCEVKDITESSDKAFANKDLGEGVLFIPQKNEFNSPLDGGFLRMIFDTKHALFLEKDKIKFMMHIGLETVSLNGSPFDLKAKIDQKLSKSSKLIDVDLEQIKDAKLSNETLFVIDNENIKEIKEVKIYKGIKKQGEQIAEFEVELIESKTVSSEIQFKSRLSGIAEEILEIIGRDNFERVYNCATRLRFIVINKDQVDVAALKKISLVKGVNWAGTEIQIIIGGEVSKLKDEVQAAIDHKNTSAIVFKPKVPFSKKAFGFIGGVLLPTVPLFISAGLLSTLYTLITLKEFGIADPVDANAVWNANVFAGVFYIMSKVALLLAGVFFCYNANKYFGGTPVYGLLIGLIMSSRFFFPSGGIGTGDVPQTGLPGALEGQEGFLPTDYHFGEFINNFQYTQKGWFLFNLGDYPVVVKGYESSMLPYVTAGILCATIDKYVKKRVWPVMDVILRPFFVTILTILPIMFIFGPALSLVEFGFLQVIGGLQLIPIGLGYGIIAAIYPICITIGIHHVIAMGMLSEFLLSGESALATATSYGTGAMFGVAIALTIITKNAKFRSLGIGAVTAGCFGTSEPYLFGMIIPRPKVFLLGMVGGFLAGWWCGITGLAGDQMGPPIVIIGTLFSFSNPSDIPLAFIGIAIAWGVSIALVFIFYKDKKNEKYETKKLFRLMKTILVKLELADSEILVESLKANETEIIKVWKDNKKITKDYEKYVVNLVKLGAKLDATEAKENKIKEQYFNNYKNAKMAKKVNEEKVAELIKKYNEYNLQETINSLKTQKEKLISDSVQIVADYKDIQDNVNALSAKSINEITSLKVNGIQDTTKLNNTMFNIINAIDVAYGTEIVNEEVFTRKDLKKLKLANTIVATK